MDVLEYHDPAIDWNLFKQGTLSDDVWAQFRAAIRLCHAYTYWSDAVGNSRRSRPGMSMYGETKYARNKRRQQWGLEIKGHENHMYRAAFLAAERLWAIAALVQQRKDSVDWNLSLALMHGVSVREIGNTMTGHERANFEVLAFERFDADEEVTADPRATAKRWRAAAGYSD